MYMIFGSPNCVWCRRAVDLCLEMGVSYEYIDLSMDSESKEFIMRQGHRTVPQVYFDNDTTLNHIGGYEALRDELRSANET